MMQYTIDTIVKDEKLITATVNINGKCLGSIDVCTQDKTIAAKYAEDVYLFDIRRNIEDYKALELPVDINVVETFSGGLIKTNKGFTSTDGTDGWTTATYAGQTFYQPPADWTPSVTEG